jgi:hypothetical protein
MIRTILSLATVVTVAGLITGAAHALPLTSNLGSSSLGSGEIDTSPSWRANAFTTDGVAWTLESVVLEIAVRTAGGGLQGGFQVSVHADDNTDGSGNPIPGPGTQLVLLTGPTDPSAGSSPVYLGSAPLAANTTYWVVASINPLSTTEYGWKETSVLTETGPGSIADQSFVSDDSGATWISFTDPHIFAVNVIPEPGTALLCLSGLVGLAHIGRRGARRARTILRRETT